MKAYAQWLEYPKTGSSGGWSRNAKHRPQPVVKEVVAIATMSGKYWNVGGVRKLKLNLFDLETGQWVRRDYDDIPDEYKSPRWLCDPLRRAMQASLIN